MTHRLSELKIFFEIIVWMAHTAVHISTSLEDCDKILFLILTKPACDRYLVHSTDPLVCGMYVIRTFIIWSIMK